MAPAVTAARGYTAAAAGWAAGSPGRPQAKAGFCFFNIRQPQIFVKLNYLCKMEKFADIKVIAFDADDTLWDCQSYFDDVEREYCRLLAPYAPADTVSASLFATEEANMPLLGYGCKAFVLSLIENAVRLSGGRVDGTVVGELLRLGKRLLELPATPLPGVEATLAALYEQGRYRLAVFTKGELLDQQNKLRRSRLEKYFQHVEIVSDKTERAFLNLCRRMRVAPGSVLMVGNSLKSDVAPALAAGARAVHIPFHVTWKLEQVEDFEHTHMVRIERFADLLAYV